MLFSDMTVLLVFLIRPAYKSLNLKSKNQNINILTKSL